MDSEYIHAPATVTVEFALEPAGILFESLHLLTSVDELSGLHEWVYTTARSLSPEVRTRNELVLSVFYHSSYPLHPAQTFPEYLDWLRQEDPVALRDRSFGWLPDYPEAELTAADLPRVVADVDVYLGALERIYKKKAEKGHDDLNVELHRTAHSYLSQPEALRTLIVDHMQMMWTTALQAEWDHRLPLLQESIDAYRQMDYQHLTGLEAIRAVTGRDMSSVDWWTLAEHLVFVPSPHVGPYLMLQTDDDKHTSRIIFGVRLPQGSRVRSTELSRSELNTRISALADDTRLRILELIMQQGELCAQDIITHLDLSQSAASRNLRQLTATGYLTERRRETAKCYSLNRDRVDDTLRALRRFFRTKA